MIGSMAQASRASGQRACSHGGAGSTVATAPGEERKLMRRLALSIVTLSMLGVAMVGTTTASAATDPFVGTWTSIDTDGSHQTLFVMGSGARGRHAVLMEDDAATVACGGGPAHLQGAGRVEGYVLSWSFTVTCPGTGRPPFTGRISGSFTYRAGPDTLRDDFGIIWHRSG
jgi:hypothetical protein